MKLVQTCVFNMTEDFEKGSPFQPSHSLIFGQFLQLELLNSIWLISSVSFYSPRARTPFLKSSEIKWQTLKLFYSDSATPVLGASRYRARRLRERVQRWLGVQKYLLCNMFLLTMYSKRVLKLLCNIPWNTCASRPWCKLWLSLGNIHFII